MGGLAEKIRKRKREEHRKKKEEERRRQEEQRKAEEDKRKANLACDENDGYSRVYGKYGWQWINNKDKNSASEPETNAQTSLVNNESVARPPAMRSLDNKLGASSSFATKAKPILSNGASGTVSFLSNTTVEASPLSDVTCSQSPSKSSKPRAIAFPKPNTIKEENDEAVDPIMAIMMRKEAEKAKMKVADSPSLQLNPSMNNERRLSREGAPKQAHDPMQIARKKEEERAKTKDELKSEDEDEQEASPRAEAKNPFALMRNEERRSFSPGSAGPVQQAPAADLWEDSEEEEESKEAKNNKKKQKKRGRPKKNPPSDDDDEEAESPPAKKSPAQSRKAPPKKKASLESAPRRRKSREQDDSSASDIDSDSDIDCEQDDVLIPSFRDPKMGPPSALEPMELPRAKDQNAVHVIPASINRYLRGYQQQGVTFMYSCIMRKSGGILGDDMGLGKTVQVISLLAALFGKTGTGKDASDLSRRRRLISQKLREIKVANDQALLFNRAQVETPDASDIEGLSTPEWAPVLVIVPSSVIDNWVNEFQAWGHFGVSTYQGKGRDLALEKVKTGASEVLVCSKALGSSSFTELATVQWKLIVVDEFHVYKNNKSKAHEKLRELRDLCRCPILGLTGTVMPNKHEELFHLVDLVAPGHLGDGATFKMRYSNPIKYARTKAADAETIQQSISCHHELDAKLKQVYIQRTKEGELGDELPEKNETILFCEPTAIQKAMYLHILTLPDFELLRYANAPCDCGVNRGIFMGYKRLRTQKERIHYTRMHKNDIKKRKECCYTTPLNPAREGDDEPLINPNAALWRFQHPEDEQCERCPYCVQFPAINKLYKLSNHAALLLAEQDPDSLEEGSEKWIAATKDVAFAKAAIPPQILAELPGGDTNPYVRQDNVMNDHAKFSGKFDKLDKLLRAFDRGDNRVLIFSHYTKTLDLIQQFVSACGYSYLRLDGSTSTPERQKLVDQYQNDPTIFLFLISTKAGGLGLNLTAANKVICFDLDFNPSHDEQAQDRSYRVGQKKEVQVVRLIASGTIEEQKYIRQIYKVHLTNDTIKDTQETGQQARMFRAVQGDKSRKGEIFGIENLLKFKDGSFMSEFWRTDSRSSRNKDGTINADALTNAVNELSTEQVEEIGGNTLDKDFHQAATSLNDGDSFVGAARGNAALKQEGGAEGDVKRPSVKEQSSDEEAEFVDIAEVAGDTAKTLNHQDLLFRRPEEESDDDEIEVLGGQSQGILAVFDRNRSDDDDGSDAEVNNEDDSVGGKPQPPQQDFPLQPPPRAAYPPPPPPQPMDASPSPTPGEVTSPEDDTRVDDLLPQKRGFAGMDLEAALDDINDDPPPQEEQEIVEAPEPEPKKPKKKAVASKKAPGKEKTSFSSRDLAMPAYSKKKKKKTEK